MAEWLPTVLDSSRPGHVLYSRNGNLIEPSPTTGLGQERKAEAILGAYLSEVGAELVDLESDEIGRELFIVATVRSTHPIGADWVDEVAATLTEVLERNTQLDVVALPVIRSGEP